MEKVKISGKKYVKAALILLVFAALILSMAGIKEERREQSCRRTRSDSVYDTRDNPEDKSGCRDSHSPGPWRKRRL